MSDYTKLVFVFLGAVLAFFLLLIAAGAAVHGSQFFLFKLFAPAMEDARRETFENSKAYNQGTVQELQNMQFEYIKAAPEHKAALAAVILHRAADYPEDQMPSALRSFVQSIKPSPSSESYK